MFDHWYTWFALVALLLLFLVFCVGPRAEALWDSWSGGEDKEEERFRKRLARARPRLTEEELRERFDQLASDSFLEKLAGSYDP